MSAIDLDQTDMEEDLDLEVQDPMKDIKEEKTGIEGDILKRDQDTLPTHLVLPVLLLVILNPRVVAALLRVQIRKKMKRKK
jgi:hypothetical protein